MSAENVELARHYVEVWNAGKLDATEPLRHPDMELYDPPDFPDADRFVGEAAARQRVESYMSMGWDGHFHVHEFIDAGEDVIFVWSMRGRGPLGDVPMDQVFAHVYRFTDGKLSVIRQYLSKEAALEATPGAQTPDAASP
jgi:ketosteroid isomerase-like protein